jgi:hypothetical protein
MHSTETFYIVILQNLQVLSAQYVEAPYKRGCIKNLYGKRQNNSASTAGSLHQENTKVFIIDYDVPERLWRFIIVFV